MKKIIISLAGLAVIFVSSASWATSRLPLEETVFNPAPIIKKELGIGSPIAAVQEGNQIFLARNVYVKPHVRKNSTYVPGHYRTKPDSSRLNNWSTKGNANPYTGKKGSQDPFRSW